MRDLMLALLFLIVAAGLVGIIAENLPVKARPTELWAEPMAPPQMPEDNSSTFSHSAERAR